MKTMRWVAGMIPLVAARLLLAAEHGSTVERLCAQADAYTARYLKAPGEQRWVLLAMKTALDARQLDRAAAQPHVSLAKAFLAQGKADAGRQRLQQALRLDPGHGEARRLLEELSAGASGGPPPPVGPSVREIALPAGAKYIGQVEDGQPHRWGTYVSPQGVQYVGQWDHGRMVGQGKFTWPNEGQYVGRVEDGRPAGGLLCWPNGRVTWSSRDAGHVWNHEAVGRASAIGFNNGRWNDLTAAMGLTPVVNFFTDNKARGTAEVVLWAAYEWPQHFSLRHFLEQEMPDGGRNNHGDRAVIQMEPLGRPTGPRQGLLSRLQADGVPESLRQGLLGYHVYRITITVNDQGHYASYLLTSVLPARHAVGRARLDVLEDAVGRARVSALTVRR